MAHNKPMRVVPTKVVQDSDKPVPMEVLAEAIVGISKAVKELNGGRVTREAVVALIQFRTKLPLAVIRQVLDTAADLERDFTKK